MSLRKIVNLHASWCAPCKAFEPTFNSVATGNEFKNITFERFDIEDDEKGVEFVEKFNVRSVPTTLLLDENDNQIMKISGNIQEEEFVRVIRNNLN